MRLFEKLLRYEATSFIYREEFGESFVYDENKNVVSVAALSTQKSNITYDDADNIKTYQQPGAASGVKYTMNYGSTSAERKRHLLLTSTTPMGVKQTNTYDAVGNLLTSTNQKNSTSPLIKTETTYNHNGVADDKINNGIKDNSEERSVGTSFEDKKEAARKGSFFCVYAG